MYTCIVMQSGREALWTMHRLIGSPVSWYQEHFDHKNDNKKAVAGATAFIFKSYQLLLSLWSVNWASASASTAIDANVCIDNVLAITFTDSFYWTFSSTSAT